MNNFETHRDIVREFLKFFFILNRQDWTGKKVLEIGAGETSMQKEFADVGMTDYAAIDNFSEYKGEGVIKCDAHDMSKHFDNEYFDFVFMSHTAEHFENPVKAFKEIHRVLKYGGIVISVTPYPCEHQILFGDPQHVSVFNELQWLRILTNSEFKVVQSIAKQTYDGVMIPRVQDWAIVSTGIK